MIAKVFAITCSSSATRTLGFAGVFDPAVSTMLRFPKKKFHKFRGNPYTGITRHRLTVRLRCNDTLTADQTDSPTGHNFNTYDEEPSHADSDADSYHTRRTRRKILRTAQREPNPSHIPNGPVHCRGRDRCAAGSF